MQVHPQRFWFGKNLGKIPEIWAKSVKTFAKSLKIWANSLKIRAKMAPNVFWFKKNCAQRDSVWKNGAQYRLHENKFTQKVAQKYFGQVWGNSGKNPLHPQKFACSYTYGRPCVLMSGKSDVLVTELRKAVSLVVVQYYATCYVSEHRNHHIL